MKKYQIIYADPPWDYKDKNEGERKYGKITPYYNGMKTEDIGNLKINEISDKDCILFLWVTFPNLQEGLDVIKMWGFKYKTLGFSWIKVHEKERAQLLLWEKECKPFFGIGHYTKSNCEICLIGMKGKLKALKKTDSISSLVVSPIRKHSQKPDEIRDLIVKFCGDIPRIELFARQKTEGWDVWGNEVESNIVLEAKCE